MGLDKNSLVADAIGNLYRAAFFLARGKREEKLAISLIKKTSQFLSGYPRFSSASARLKKLLLEKNRLILAEKVLDEYLLMKDNR